MEEIGVGDEETRAAAVASTVSSQSQAKQEITARDEQQFEQFTSSARLSGDAAENVKISGNSERRETTKSGRKIVIEEVANGDNVTELTSTKKHSQAPSEGERTSETTETSDKVSSKAARSDKEMASPESSPRVPPVPLTSFQFQTDWKTLRHHPEKFYQYFKVNSY